MGNTYENPDTENWSPTTGNDDQYQQNQSGSNNKDVLISPNDPAVKGNVPLPQVTPNGGLVKTPDFEFKNSVVGVDPIAKQSMKSVVGNPLGTNASEGNNSGLAQTAKFKDNTSKF